MQLLFDLAKPVEGVYLFPSLLYHWAFIRNTLEFCRGKSTYAGGEAGIYEGELRCSRHCGYDGINADQSSVQRFCIEIVNLDHLKPFFCELWPLLV